MDFIWIAIANTVYCEILSKGQLPIKPQLSKNYLIHSKS